MVESLALRAWGPVGLLHMQKAAIKYKKPTRRVWNTHSMWVQHEQRWARRAGRGARTDFGLSDTGDSVGGPECSPRQRRGFGEDSSPKPLGKSPNRNQAART